MPVPVLGACGASKCPSASKTAPMVPSMKPCTFEQIPTTVGRMLMKAAAATPVVGLTNLAAVVAGDEPPVRLFTPPFGALLSALAYRLASPTYSASTSPGNTMDGACVQSRTPMIRRANAAAGLADALTHPARRYEVGGSPASEGMSASRSAPAIP